jgi:hypothetical protein
MENDKSSSVILKRALSFVRRPILGPLVFGLLVEGVPVGIFLYRAEAVQPGNGNLFAYWFISISVLVASTSAILSADSRPARMLWRSFLSILPACFLAPVLTFAFLLRGSGFEFALQYLAIIFAGITLFVAVVGWLLALAFRFLWNRRTRIAQAV